MNVTIANQEYEVIIERKANRRTYMRFKDDLKLHVTTNYITSDREIKRMIADNESSLAKMIAKRVKQQAKEGNFYLFGQSYDIIMIPTMTKVEVVDHYLYAKDDKMVNRWLKQESFKLFKEHYDSWYQVLSKEGIPYYRLRLRAMKTRWGVCNKASQTITLNSNLVKYDITCLDYVIVHELAHLIYFNHSQAFWQLVAKYYPNYKECRKRLK